LVCVQSRFYACYIHVELRFQKRVYFQETLWEVGESCETRGFLKWNWGFVSDWFAAQFLWAADLGRIFVLVGFWAINA
jgi:hypothetical protein